MSKTLIGFRPEHVEISIGGVRLRVPTEDDIVELPYESATTRAERLAMLQESIEQHNRRLDSAEKRSARRELGKKR